MPNTHVRRIGVLTGGGDAPGLNAVIRAVVKASANCDCETIGLEDSFDGLIEPNRHRTLTPRDVTGILRLGGTILGTTNRGNPFQYKEVKDGQTIVHDVSKEVMCNARKLGIDATVIIGGDGTQNIALHFYRAGMNVVGVPKTIDNDLSATEVTFGFDTALHTATDAIDKLFTTAESHHRVMVLELMGREAGWIALEAGLAGGAHVILIPEIPFSIEKICDYIRERDRRGHRFTIVAVAEGIELPESLRSRVDCERRNSVRAGTVGNPGSVRWRPLCATGCSSGIGSSADRGPSEAAGSPRTCVTTRRGSAGTGSRAGGGALTRVRSSGSTGSGDSVNPEAPSRVIGRIPAGESGSRAGQLRRP
jgi:6-phosphofructokinase 1